MHTTVTRHTLPAKLSSDDVEGTNGKSGSGEVRARIALLIAALCCAPACTTAFHPAVVTGNMYETRGSSSSEHDHHEQGVFRRESGDVYEGSAAHGGADEPHSAVRGRIGSDLYGASDTQGGNIPGIDQKSGSSPGNLYEQQAKGSGSDASDVVSAERRGLEIYGGSGPSAGRSLRPAEKGAEAINLYGGEKQANETGKTEFDRHAMIVRERRDGVHYGMSGASSPTILSRKAEDVKAVDKSRLSTETGPAAIAEVPALFAPLPQNEKEPGGAPGPVVNAQAQTAPVLSPPVPGEGAVIAPIPSVSAAENAGGGETADFAAEAAAGSGGAAAPEPVKSGPTRDRMLSTPVTVLEKPSVYPEQRRETEAIIEMSGKEKMPADDILMVNRPPNIQGLTGLLFTSSAYTLPPGRAVVGASLLTEYSSQPEFSVIQVPVTLTYGVSDRIEMGLKAKIVDLDSPRYLQRAHGFGDSEVAVKWRFASQRFFLPDMAVGVCYIMPTGNENKHLNEVVNWGAKFAAIASLEGKTSSGHVFGVYLESQAVFIDELYRRGSSTPGAERYGVINGGVLFPVSGDNRLQLIAEYNQILYKSGYQPTMIEGNENAATAAVRYVTEQFSSTAGLQYINKEKSTDQNTYRFVWKISLVL